LLMLLLFLLSFILLFSFLFSLKKFNFYCLKSILIYDYFFLSSVFCELLIDLGFDFELDLFEEGDIDFAYFSICLLFFNILRSSFSSLTKYTGSLHIYRSNVLPSL